MSGGQAATLLENLDIIALTSKVGDKHIAGSLFTRSIFSKKDLIIGAKDEDFRGLMDDIQNDIGDGVSPYSQGIINELLNNTEGRDYNPEYTEGFIDEIKSCDAYKKAMDTIKKGTYVDGKWNVYFTKDQNGKDSQGIDFKFSLANLNDNNNDMALAVGHADAYFKVNGNKVDWVFIDKYDFNDTTYGEKTKNNSFKQIEFDFFQRVYYQQAISKNLNTYTTLIKFNDKKKGN